MINNFEKKQVNTLAQNDLLKKLKLERAFEPEIKSLFSRMRQDFKVTYAATGVIIPASNYSAAWEDALRKHYRRVQKEFTGVVEQQQKSIFPPMQIKQDEEEVLQEEQTEEELALFLLALLLFRDGRAPEQEKFITKTNNKNMRDSVEKAIQSLSDQGLPTNNRNVANAAATNLSRKLNGRVGNISTLETQATAEATKLFEAKSLSGISPSPDVTTIDDVFRPTKPTEDVTKTWRTVGDKDVRVAHKEANFQTVGVDEPFVVMGQSLDYPGDTSMGATLENVSGCRCSAIYKNLPVSKPVTKPVPAPKPKPQPKPKPKPKEGTVPPDKNLSKAPKNKPVLKGGRNPVKKPITVDKPNTDNFQKVGKPFTADEKAYAEWYSGDGFKEINDYTRNPASYADSQTKVKSLEKYKKNLSSAISKSELKTDTTVYRGIDSKEFKKIAEGGTLKNLDAKSFQSTSLSPQSASVYSGADGTILRIKVPKGTKALNMNKYNLSNNASEAEVLLDHGGSFIVKGVSKGAETIPGVRRTILDVEYVPKR